MFQNRSYELELIDKGEYTPEEYDGFLREIRIVNRWLGDVNALKETLLREVEKENLMQFSVLDVGAGSGELLRVAAKWARRKRKAAQFYGLDLNERSPKLLRDESKNFKEITSIRGDALSLPFAENSFDYVFCSLFTHHFTDEKVVEILREMRRVAQRKIYVIDLHRNPTAYFFYTRFATIILRNRLVRHDGALSILRSFVPEELEQLGKQAGLKNPTVTKHFPSRLVLSGSI